MKKLTAGIFTVLIGLCAANSADAAIASKAWVEQDFATKTALSDAQNTLQSSIDTKANAADVYTIKQADEKFEQQSEALAKLQSAKDYTDAQVETLMESLGGTGEDGESTGLTGTVAAQGVRITSLEDKVGSTAVADQISQALSSYTNTTDMNAAIKTVSDALDTHKTEAASTYATIANLNAANQAISGLESSKEASANKISDFASASTEDKDSDTKFPTTAFTQDMIDATVASTTSQVNSLSSKLTALQGTVNTNATTASDATAAVAKDLADYKSTNDTAVSANAEAISAINNAETGILKQSKDYTDSEIDKLENSLNGTSTNLSDLVERVDTAEGKITTLEGTVGDSTKGLVKAATDNAAAAAAAAKQASDNAALIALNSEAIEAEEARAKAAEEANAAAAAAAQETANAAIPKPAGACADPDNKCVLTFNNSTYTWEVIERATGEVVE